MAQQLSLASVAARTLLGLRRADGAAIMGPTPGSAAWAGAACVTQAAMHTSTSLRSSGQDLKQQGVPPPAPSPPSPASSSPTGQELVSRLAVFLVPARGRTTGKLLPIADCNSNVCAAHWCCTLEPPPWLQDEDPAAVAERKRRAVQHFVVSG